MLGRRRPSTRARWPRRSTRPAATCFTSPLQFAARTVANEMNLRWQILQSQSADPKLRERLHRASNTPDGRRRVQDWLDRLQKHYDGTSVASNWFVTDRDGNQLARAPLGDSIGAQLRLPRLLPWPRPRSGPRDSRHGADPPGPSFDRLQEHGERAGNGHLLGSDLGRPAGLDGHRRAGCLRRGRPVRSPPGRTRQRAGRRSGRYPTRMPRVARGSCSTTRRWSRSRRTPTSSCPRASSRGS